MTNDPIFDLISALELTLSVGDVKARLKAAKLHVERVEDGDGEGEDLAAAFADIQRDANRDT